MSTLQSELALIDSPSVGLVTINLRGTKFTIPLNAAHRLPASHLARVLSGSATPPPLRDDEGNLFFNRNPTVFHLVLDAVESGEVMFPDSDGSLRRLLDAELRYWGVGQKRPRDELAKADEQRVSAPRYFGQCEVQLPPSANNGVGASFEKPAILAASLVPPQAGFRGSAGLGFRPQ